MQGRNQPQSMHCFRPPWQRVVPAYALIIAVLVAGFVTTQVLSRAWAMPNLLGLVPLFHLDRENNLPTFFSSLQLLTAAALMGLIAAHRFAQRQRFARHWLVLAVLFAFLAADESASLHELLVDPMRRWGGEQFTTGLLHMSWMVPVLAVLVPLGLVYLRFLAALPRRTRGWLVGAAALYIGGAVGVEMLVGPYIERHGMQTDGYLGFVLVEETMELAGILVLIHGLLGHAATSIGRFAVELRPLSSTLRRPSSVDDAPTTIVRGTARTPERERLTA